MRRSFEDYHEGPFSYRADPLEGGLEVNRWLTYSNLRTPMIHILQDKSYKALMQKRRVLKNTRLFLLEGKVTPTSFFD